MFGSTILDVAIGLIFSFLAVSLFTSAAVEAINSLLQLRAVNLKSGIMALVNDPGFAGLAKALYAHPLVSPLGPGVPPGPAAGAPVAARPATDNSTYVSRVKDVAMFWRPAGPAYVDIKTLPAYIDPSQFARALVDVTGLSAAWAAGAAAAPPARSPGAPRSTPRSRRSPIRKSAISSRASPIEPRATSRRSRRKSAPGSTARWTG